jgi:CheY-like chemotaxis protein
MADEAYGDSVREFGVLVVDDDEAVLDALCFGLRQRGFTVWSAADGRSAVNLYGKHHERIDIVLLDVRLPDFDGPQVLMKLRKLSTRFHVCFMSGDLGGYSAQALADMGAVAVYRKPLSAVDVAEEAMQIVNDPKLNPSFIEARKRVRRRPPREQTPAPVLTFVLRNMGRDMPLPMSQFHGDHQLRWTGKE